MRSRTVSRAVITSTGTPMRRSRMLLQHFDTVAPRQPEVEHHQRIRRRCDGELGLLAVADPVDRVALGLQAVGNALADHRVVFNEQDAHGVGSQVREVKRPQR